MNSSGLLVSFFVLETRFYKRPCRNVLYVYIYTLNPKPETVGLRVGSELLGEDVCQVSLGFRV